MVYTFTTENFDAEVLKSDVPVFVDFYADWCGPCKMMSPVIDKLADEYEGKIKVGKVNVDEESALANQFGIESIPTLVVIQNGKVVQTAVGYRGKAAILSML